MVKTRDAYHPCFIRAQVHRLMKNNEAAMKDLDKVISTLGKGQPSILRQVNLSLYLPITNADMVIIIKAYTQRAILKRSQGDAEGSRIDFEQGMWGEKREKHDFMSFNTAQIQ